ncbi:MAG: hypothetical protein HY905_09885 [Deltaproteobacteria bacterium]|nr:hypothetical protein [Deltaproteobacteria bacterium]
MQRRVLIGMCSGLSLLAVAACGSRPSANGSSNPAADRGGEAAATADGAGSTAAELRLELRTPKTVYAEGEALEFTAWLVNGTAAPVVVLRRAAHVDLSLDAVNEAGEFITTLLPPEPPMPPTADDLATIDPGAELELRDWELLQRVNEQIVGGNERTGRFVVTARYHAGTGLTENLRELDPAAWVGSLTSNTVLIEVR